MEKKEKTYLSQELSLLTRKMRSMQREVTSLDLDLKSVEKVSFIYRRATSGKSPSTLHTTDKSKNTESKSKPSETDSPSRCEKRN